MSGLLANSELRAALWGLMPQWKRVFFYSLVVSLLALAPIGYMRDVYGPVLDARSTQTLLWVTLVLVAALLISGILEWARARVLQVASVRFAEAMSARVFQATFDANLQKIPGARQSLGDLRTIRAFIASPTVGVIMDVPLGLVFMILVFMIHPLMGVMSLMGAILIGALGWWSERRVRPLLEKAQRHNHAAQNFTADASRNAQVIEAMGMGPSLYRRWMREQGPHLRDQALATESQGLSAALTKLVMMSQGSLLMAVGMLFTLWEILPPSAGAFLIIAKLLGNRAVGPMLQLINSWKLVVAARDSFLRLEEFLRLVPRPEERMRMPAPNGHLVLEGVSARAPGTKKTVVMDVSVAVKPGRVLAVIGASGSGKSSLARLMVGVWAPIVGKVRLDGVDIQPWNKAELGPYLGYLPQDVELFDGTLAENIARFGDIDPDAMREAVSLAGLDPIVSELPDGLSSRLGEAGAVLSGGQRQRVGIARALYGNPRLVVLDEPNSSLDHRGDLDLARAILLMRQRGAAVVIVTHREELLQVADYVLVMEDGRGKMYGGREKVMEELQKQRQTEGEPEAGSGR